MKNVVCQPVLVLGQRKAAVVVETATAVVAAVAVVAEAKTAIVVAVQAAVAGVAHTMMMAPVKSAV